MPYLSDAVFTLWDRDAPKQNQNAGPPGRASEWAWSWSRSFAAPVEKGLEAFAKLGAGRDGGKVGGLQLQAGVEAAFEAGIDAPQNAGEGGRRILENRQHQLSRRRQQPGGLHHAGHEADAPGFLGVDGRSEEHTSELQSLRHLVCRLL